MDLAYDSIQRRFAEDDRNAFARRIQQPHTTAVDFSWVERMHLSCMQPQAMSLASKLHRAAETDQDVIVGVRMGQAIELVFGISVMVHAHPEVWCEPEPTVIRWGLGFGESHKVFFFISPDM